MADYGDGKFGPIFTRKQLLKIGLNLIGINLIAEAKTVAEPLYVGIDRPAGLAVSHTENHIGCFSTDTGQFCEQGVIGGHYATVFSDEHLGAGLNILCLGIVIAACLDQLFDMLDISFCKVFGCGVGFE